jgi:hypothetical protein
MNLLYEILKLSPTSLFSLETVSSTLKHRFEGSKDHLQFLIRDSKVIAKNLPEDYITLRDALKTWL